MINPLRSINLNGYWYKFEEGSFKETIGLKNSSDEAQNGRQFSVLGKTSPKFTATIALENTYYVHVGSSTTTGITTWLGISQLDFLKTVVGAAGTSMPLTFVTPYGVTYSVVPTGALDIQMFNPSNPSDNGVEFRVSLTLEST